MDKGVWAKRTFRYIAVSSWRLVLSRHLHNFQAYLPYFELDQKSRGNDDDDDDDDAEN
jgi:hypothetical protein